MTTIQDTLTYADGSMANGRLVVTWKPFTVGNVNVAGGELDWEIVEGNVTVQLYSNTTALPVGVYYIAKYELENGPVYVEQWMVPNLPTVTLGQVRVNFPPTPSVMISPLQLSPIGSQPGMFLMWNGSHWVPGYPTLVNFTPNTIGLSLNSLGNDVSVAGSPAYLGQSLTLSVPDAGPAARGVVTTAAQTFAGAKSFQSTVNILASMQFTRLARNPTSYGELLANGTGGLDTELQFGGNIVAARVAGSDRTYMQADRFVGGSYDMSTVGAIPTVAMPGSLASPTRAMASILFPVASGIDWSGIGTGVNGTIWLRTGTTTSAGFLYLDTAGNVTCRELRMDPYQHQNAATGEAARTDATMVMYSIAGQWAGYGVNVTPEIWFRLGPDNAGVYYYFGQNGARFPSLTVGSITITGPGGFMTDPTTTQGDLIARGASAPATRLGVGSPGQVLTADPASPSGLGVKWATPAATGVPTTRTILPADATLTGGGDLSMDRTFAVVADTSVQQLQFALAGTLTSTRHRLNFVAGSGINFNLVDDGPNNQGTLTVTAVATGAPSPSIFAVNGAVIGTQSELNLIASTNVTLVGVNNTGAGRVDITVSMSGGGAVTSVFTRIGAVVALAADYAAFYVPLARQVTAGTGLTGGGDLSADRRFDAILMGASGASHSIGMVPDPGATSGVTKFLREDATWVVPAGAAQSPWTSDINAANFKLNSVGAIGIGALASAGNPLTIQTAASGTPLLCTNSNSASSASMMFSNDAAASLMCGIWGSAAAANAGLAFLNASGGALIIQTAGAERVRITATGMGIGVTPAYRIDAAGDCNITGTYRVNGVPISTGGGGTPAGLTGQVQFNNAGAFGASANLFWDITNFRLGIGTATVTAAKLVINQTSATAAQLLMTSSPVNAGDYQEIKFQFDPSTAVVQSGIRSIRNQTAGYGAALAFMTEDTGDVYAERMRITAAGNVGIGVAVPNSLGDGGTPTILQLHGGIGATPFALFQLSTNSVAAGNPTGSIAFGTTGATGSQRTAEIVSAMTAASGTNAVGNLIFYTSNGSALQRMVIDQNGLVGINTTTPGNLLTLAGGSATPSLRLGSTSPGYWWDIGRENAATGDFIFNNANGGASTEKVRITTAGNMGIGVVNPLTTLHVNGPIHVTGSPAGSLTSPNSVTLDFYSGYARLLSFGPDTATLGGYQFYGLHSDNSGAIISLSITPVGNVLMPSGYLAVGSGAVPQTPGDLGVSRNSAPNTGVVYFGNSASQYIYFDGSKYNINSSAIIAGTLTVNSTLTASGNLTVAGTSLLTGAVGITLVNNSGGQCGLSVVPTANPGTIAAANQITICEVGNNAGYRFNLGFANVFTGGVWAGVLQVTPTPSPLMLNPSGGNVGVGMGSAVPAYTVDVAGTVNASVGFRTLAKQNIFGVAGGNNTAIVSTDCNIILYYLSSTNWAGIGSDSSGGMWFSTRGSGTPDCRMLITSTGFIGIAQTAPGLYLHLGQDSAGKPGTSAWTVISDGRTKRDLRPFLGGLDTLLKLHPVHFTYNGEASTPEGLEGVGVVAQDVVNIIPSCIKPIIARIAGQETQVLGVNTGDLTWMMVNAFQEIDQRLRKLEGVEQWQ